MANEDIKKELEELNIEYPKTANKNALIKLLEEKSHKLTEEELEENPGYKEAGLAVGDRVGEFEEVLAPVITESTEDESEGDKSPKAPEKAPEELEQDLKGTILVVSNLSHDNVPYKKGDTWPFAEIHPEVTKDLIREGILK